MWAWHSLDAGNWDHLGKGEYVIYAANVGTLPYLNWYLSCLQGLIVQQFSQYTSIHMLMCVQNIVKLT